MSHDRHPELGPSATDPTVGPDATASPGAPPTAVHPGALDVQIRNLRGGQSIEMDVRGPWSEDALEERLMRFVAVRQPAALQVNVDATHTDREPRLTRARAAIEGFGGSLTVALTSFTRPEPA